MIPKRLPLALLLIGVVSALALVAVQFMKLPSYPPLPQEYDIDKINAMVADRGVPPAPPTTLGEWRSLIIQQMTDYLKESQTTDYSQKHLVECAALLDRFIAEVTRADKKGETEHILETSKTLVLALNALNAQCNHGMIETSEREMLCEMIFFGARQGGYSGVVDFQHDFTEPWREW